MQGLRTTIYFVTNVEEARDWYAKIFDAKPYYDTPYYVGFNIGGYELGLHPSEVQPDTKGKSVVSYWGVDDIEATYNRMLELGAKPEEAPNNVGGDIVVAAVKDPWNNIVGIIYNPHFKLPE